MTLTTILLVEDEIITAMLEKQQLEQKGYTVQHITTGEEAVKVILDNTLPVDLILMDIDLGTGIDGTQAAEKILKEKDIPIVFLSSHTEPEIVEKTEKITSYGYVVKNSAITVLDASIKMALKFFYAKNERKRTEKSLKESEKNLTNILNNMTDVVWRISWPDLTHTYLSPSLEKLYGKSKQEFMDNPLLFLEVTHPDDRHLTEKAMKQLTEEGEAERECRIIKPDGSIVWVNDRSKMIYDENHQPIMVEGVTRDITDCKQLQLELTESAERFKALHNASFGGIAIHDKGIILECNQGLSDMTGYSLSELIGMDGLLLIAPEHREMVMNKIATGYEKAYEANGLTKNADIFPMRLEARNVPYKGKNVRTVEFRDITESKQAEEELKKQLIEKEILLREVHHRVKNNITSIESFLVLQNYSIANPEAKEAINTAVSRVQSMRVLYDKLLVSKDFREISIKNYIEDLIESLQNVFVEKGNIIIEKHISEFSIIPKQAINIGIIINELLTNVFKYAFKDRDKENVFISIDKKDNTVTIIIQDNGIGIDERIMENKSPGFGLTIVKMLVEQLKGTYSIVNKNGTRSVIQFEL